MKIVRFLGGLGNQMFQYAFYLSLQSRFADVRADLQGYKDYPLHNGFELEAIFDLKLNKISAFSSKLYYIHNRKWIYRKLRRILNLKNLYEEERGLFEFDPQVYNTNASRYYWGYWQNFHYFERITNQLRSDFHFKKPLQGTNLGTLQKISQTNSVSVHIRRGDYMNDSLLGGLCGLDYYNHAIKYLQQYVEKPSFFIFSDDIQWCKENLDLRNAAFISWNNGHDSYIDMQLMSNCKHNIIANSSFSWWGAWLNQNEKKIVIYPKQWTNDSEINMPAPQTWLAL